jgi:transposase InsO family protein
VGQHRSTQRHRGKIVDIEEVKLRHRLREIAAEHIRWGRRMAYRLLRREGWLVNHKRVHRLWREEGLQRPSPRKQKRARPADGSVRRHQAEHPHQVWAMDFQFDATADGRRQDGLIAAAGKAVTDTVDLGGDLKGGRLAHGCGFCSDHLPS